MAAAGKTQQFTADGQSNIKLLKGWSGTNTNAAIATIDLRDGGSGGAILLTFGIAATTGLVSQTLGDGIVAPSGNWYVDVTNLTGTVTIWGD